MEKEMHQKTVVEKAMEYCCCATYRAVGLDEMCGICELVDAFITLDDQRANMWRIIHTVKMDQEGAMSLTESLHALVALLGETNDALAACQSEGTAWKRLAEERAWKIDAHEYVLSQRGEKTLYWAA